MMGLQTDTELVLGRANNSRDARRIIINKEDRQNIVIFGNPGSGKTKMFKRLVKQDIENGTCVLLIARYHDFDEDILPIIPKDKRDKIVQISLKPTQEFNPIVCLNPLEIHEHQKRSEQIHNCISAMVHCFPGVLGVFEVEMMHKIVELLTNIPGSVKFLDVLQMLFEKKMMAHMLEKCTNEDVKVFWNNTFPHRSSQISMLMSEKFSKTIDSDMIKLLSNTEKPSISIQDIISEKRIVVVDLESLKEENNFVVMLLAAMFSFEGIRYANKFPDKTSFNIYVNGAHMLSSNVIQYLIDGCMRSNAKSVISTSLHTNYNLTNTHDTSKIDPNLVSVLRAFCKHIVVFQSPLDYFEMALLYFLKDQEQITKLDNGRFELFVENLKHRANFSHIHSQSGILEIE